MIPWPELTIFVRSKLDQMPRAVWLDVFFLILKEEGRSYGRVRTAWLRQQQLELRFCRETSNLCRKK